MNTEERLRNHIRGGFVLTWGLLAASLGHPIWLVFLFVVMGGIYWISADLDYNNSNKS